MVNPSLLRLRILGGAHSLSCCTFQMSKILGRHLYHLLARSSVADLAHTAGKGSQVVIHHGNSRDIHNTAVLQAKYSSFKKDKVVRSPPVDKPYIPPVASAPINSTTKVARIRHGMTLKEFAEQMGQRVETVQGLLTGLGEVVNSVKDIVAMDAAELVAYDLGYDVKRLHYDTLREDTSVLASTTTKLEPRSAVITVMGHVDHGKTSLLDALRQTSVAAKEAGGITQHIGAFVVNMPSGTSLTFLDTPGHAAFSAMRARGAAVTDIVVLVVAADDGVMPQTREALSHAQAAQVPIVVAINKCDKPDANPARVRQQLGAEGVELEEMGGDVQVVEVSATKNIGLDKLEDALLLQAELMDLRSPIDGEVHAVVVEARLDRGRGPLATAIVRKGTLAPGLHIVVGSEWGRIRSLIDTWGHHVKSAGPSIPVEIEGLKGLPQAGDDIIVVVSEERARKLSQGRKNKLEQERLRNLRPKPVVSEVTEEENPEKEETVELALVVKGDVQGTVQAVSQALQTLNSSQVMVNIVHAGVGPVSLSDVDLAVACGACIVCFNIRSMAAGVEAAVRRSNVDVRQHRIIYRLLEDIGQLIVSKAPGMLETQVAGQAEVLSTFEIKGKGSKKDSTIIAGCRVFEGRIMKSCDAKVLRSGEVIFEGKFHSLKREKLDVDAVGKGNDCGMIVEGFGEYQVKDVIQCIELVRRKPRFVSSESGSVKIES